MIFRGRFVDRRISAHLLINQIAKTCGSESYLEIGIDRATTFQKISVENKTGIDPVKIPLPIRFKLLNAKIYREYSNFYLERIPSDTKWDLFFIDGLHEYNQTLDDILNCILHSKPESVLIIDDVVPCDKFSAIPDQNECYLKRSESGDTRNKQWQGDVYKILEILHESRTTSLHYRTVCVDGSYRTVIWFADTVDFIELVEEIREGKFTPSDYSKVFSKGIPSYFNLVQPEELLSILSNREV